MATEETDTDQKHSPRPSRPLAGALTIAAGLGRLIPHWWNFTPVGALGLFSGARLRSWHAVALPIILMAATDVILWWWKDNRPFDAFVYLSFLLYVLIGRVLCQTNSPWRIGAASLLGSMQFYLITNFGAWLTFIRQPDSLYPATFDGLVACYIAGIPFFGRDVAPPLGFFGNMVLGDLFFSGLLFGAYALLARRVRARESVPATKDLA